MHLTTIPLIPGLAQISQQIAMVSGVTGIPYPALMELVVVTLALLIGTTIRLTVLFGRGDIDADRIGSLKTWWTLWSAVLLSVWIGPLGVVVLLAMGSFLAYREYVRLTLESADAPTARYVGYGLIAVNYMWIMLDERLAWMLFVPAASVAVFAASMVISGRTRHFRSAFSGLVLGTVLVGYLPSHAAGVTLLGTDVAIALVVLLLVLTETNDIAQAHVGRAFGRRKVVPTISPKKTWAGLIGGVTVTALVAALLGTLVRPNETSLPGGLDSWPIWMAALGAVTAIAGFFGDAAISGLKRDRGVKDSGGWLPGHGGVLDRLDSLLFTAPTFFYGAVWCWDLSLF